MNNHPPIMLVDENDQPIGSASLDEAHFNGLMHRIVVVIVEDDAGQILLQKRGLQVATHPEMWDASAAGHVDEGESYEQAALRELREEIGIEGYSLAKIDKVESHTETNGRKLNRFKMIYKVVVPAGTNINFDPEELLEARWFTKDELKKMVVREPDQLVPDFVELLNKYFL